MQLRYEQLTHHLKKQTLSPIYWISGEETLLVQTACEAIRQRAHQLGFIERNIFYAESHFNWQTFLLHSRNYGLFEEKQILEVHLPTFTEAASSALQDYAKAPPSDKVLLIRSNKLDKRQQQTAWFKDIDKEGIFIAVWPLEAAQLKQWITKQFETLHLKVDPEGIQCLIAATEGNLLATKQEIEKLSLYFANEISPRINQEKLLQALADNARFDPFKLVDAALQAEAKRSLRILKRCREEGVEPLFILWAISRECRQLARLSWQTQNNSHQTDLKNPMIFPKRRQLLQNALRRYPLKHWHELIHLAAYCDQGLKGAETILPWQVLQKLLIRLTGLDPL